MMEQEPVAAEPHFQPFRGRDYECPTRFPGRLLILGESHYLRKPEDDRADFTQQILADVICERLMRGWRTRYFTNLFYLLTGKRGRDVPQSEWEAVWNSLAFYNFAQTARLTRPLMRPTKWEWQDSIRPFRTVLSRLRPEFIIITGSMLNWYVSKDPKYAKKKEGVIGVWIPTAENEYAFARCIYHPSSIRFLATRENAREIVKGLFDRSWLASDSVPK